MATAKHNTPRSVFIPFDVTLLLPPKAPSIGLRSSLGHGQETGHSRKSTRLLTPHLERLPSKPECKTFVHFTLLPSRTVILSVAKNLTARPFTSFRVTTLVYQSNAAWFSQPPRMPACASVTEPNRAESTRQSTKRHDVALRFHTPITIATVVVPDPPMFSVAIFLASSI